MTAQKKIVVGVNTSFDSIAAIILLKLQGFDVIGIHILLDMSEADKLINKDQTSCLNQSNKNILEDIFSELTIPLYFVNQKENFTDSVVDTGILASFMKEYHAQCLICHKVKIVSLFEKMKKLNADFIATGHYAKLRKAGRGGLVSLFEISDKKLDQHKLLASVDQTILDKMLLPLSDLGRDKVIAIVKQHLPKHYHHLTAGTQNSFCPLLKDDFDSIKKSIPPSMNRKNKIFSRDNKTFLNESYDNSEFEFGQSIKVGSDHRGKEQSLMVTGFNYSYQTIYVNEQPTSGVNYFFVQIIEFFGKPDLFEPMNAMISINDESVHLPALVYFKGLNYALVFLKSGSHEYIPNKSILYIHEETRQGMRLCFFTKVVNLGKAETAVDVGPMSLAKIDGDYPF